MKIGINSNTMDIGGYGRFGNDTYKKLREHGYLYTDLSISNTDLPVYYLPQEQSDALLLREKEMAEAAGIKINQVHGPWRWPLGDATVEDRAERMEKMKKSIRAASILGSKYWVIHPIMPYGIEELGTEYAPKTWELNREFMTELLKTAKEYDVIICLENLPFPEFSMATPEAVLKFVREMDDDHFKICLDTGHVSVFDNLNLADEVRRVGSELKTLHVHDNKQNKDLHLMPHYGVIDWKDFVKSLKDINFEGVFSLETKPAPGLNDEMFDRMGKLLYEIAEDIAKDLDKE